MQDSFKRKPRHAKRRIAGSYPVASGTAEIIADDLRDGGFTLALNHVPSSYIVLGAPRVLGFQYMQWTAAVLHTGFDNRLGDALKFLHLGGAGCALPRYTADVWPQSTNTVVEIDDQLIELVSSSFDIPPEPRVNLVCAEARGYTLKLPPKSTDVIIRDVFDGGSIPTHLLTEEFFAEATEKLRPGGIYVANSTAYPGLQTTRKELATMCAVFDHVFAISNKDIIEGRRYGNIVLIGSTHLLEVSAIGRKLIDKTGDGNLRVKDTSWAKELSRGVCPRRDEDPRGSRRNGG